MGYGYSPFDSGFGGFQFDDPLEEERKRREEERKKKELEAAEATSLRQAMDTEPSWDDAVPDVSGKLPDVEEPSPGDDTPNPGSIVETEEESKQRIYLELLAKHIETMPNAADPQYEQGVGERFMSHWNPEMRAEGGQTPRYRNAMAEWEAKSKALGNVAELESRGFGQDTTRRGQDITAETADENRVVREAELEQTKAKLEQTIANETDDNKRADAQLELDKLEAGISQQRADIYGKSVESLGEARRAAAARPPTAQEISLGGQAQLEQLALEDVITQNPKWEKFARFVQEGVGEGNLMGRASQVPGKDIPFWPDPDPGAASDDPDFQEFMDALELARLRRGRLAGVEGITPLPR